MERVTVTVDKRFCEYCRVPTNHIYSYYSGFLSWVKENNIPFGFVCQNCGNIVLAKEPNNCLQVKQLVV